MRHFLVIIAILFAAAYSYAEDGGVSIRVGTSGFYGRVDIGDAPRPVVIYREPIIIHRHRPIVQEPIYLHVPPGHAKNGIDIVLVTMPATDPFISWIINGTKKYTFLITENAKENAGMDMTIAEGVTTHANHYVEKLRTNHRFSVMFMGADGFPQEHDRCSHKVTMFVRRLGGHG